MFSENKIKLHSHELSHKIGILLLFFELEIKHLKSEEAPGISKGRESTWDAVSMFNH